MNSYDRSQKRPAGGMRLCSGCADKINHLYEIREIEDARQGHCSLCGNYFYLSLYEVRPKRRRYNTRAGGGERAKAGG